MFKPGNFANAPETNHALIKTDWRFIAFLDDIQGFNGVANLCSQLATFLIGF